MERETVAERKSKIFGNKQLALLEERVKGSKDDPTGQFQLQVVPKIKEMLDLWFPRKTELEECLKMRQKKYNDAIAEIPKEQKPTIPEPAKTDRPENTTIL
jgi:hypothetical protein